MLKVHLLYLLAISSCIPCQAALVQFEFSGSVSSLYDENGAGGAATSLDIVQDSVSKQVVLGEAVTMSVLVDSTNPIPIGTGGTRLDYSVVGGEFSFAGGFASNLNALGVVRVANNYNGPSSYDGIIATGLLPTSAVNITSMAPVILTDSSQQALTSTDLPQSINLANWPNVSGRIEYDAIHSIYLTWDSVQVNIVPEPGHVSLFMASLLFFGWRGRNRP